MAPLVAVLADDLTGAADTGIGFRRSGLRTVVGWDLSLLSGPYDVVALDLGTRALGAAAAAERVGLAVAAARSAGVETLYKKVDSLARGQLGPEVRAALDAWGPRSVAIVAPAFPAVGRTTVDGWQLDRGRPVSHLVGTLVAAGVSALPNAEVVGSDGVRAVVCDASTTVDLRTLAVAGASLGRDVVWVGSGGLAAELPAALGLAGSFASAVPSVRPVLTVVGSMAPRAASQVAQLDARGRPIVSLSQLGLALREGASPVVALDLSPGEEDVRHVRLLADELARHAPSVGGLVLTGGETASSVLRAFGVTALELVDEIEHGVPVSLASGAWRGPVVTKAGTFGDADSLVRAVETLEGVR
ncbi:four-carbon acid sugar kinase family protein [Tenggerimyces flavus]|uniref:Four-carbon acid sugar kinase family protein n=1 Tax=Tenggerimyces flavus TaxID=1708749 RepID=A0ABV7YGK2_9ACTN|nr:four-carbon acid sugar kinase family protein [Tenggerimyces flavus]MBM7786818.1 4-hydroxythreonine-4-phosphate dehydrogenase [Tenggerimyces flavus]